MSQYETEIDRANITTISKFSYLKLLISKVRALIDGFSFNTEEYERAKTILQAKCAKPSELANALIECILQLPTIISLISFHLIKLVSYQLFAQIWFDQTTIDKNGTFRNL